MRRLWRWVVCRLMHASTEAAWISERMPSGATRKTLCYYRCMECGRALRPVSGIMTDG